MRRTLPGLVALTLLTGCGTTTFSPEQIDSAGDVVTQPIAKTTDSHVAREHDMHLTLRGRDREYRKAYEKSGTKVSFEVKKVNGVDMVFPIVEVKAEPRFEQQLPTKPSEHPFWGFGKELLNKGLMAFGIWELGEYGQKSLDTAKSDYFGDYSAYQSNNPGTFTGDYGTYQPFEVKPEVVRPEIVYPEIVPVGAE